MGFGAPPGPGGWRTRAFREGGVVSPLWLFLVTNVLFLVLFPWLVLGVERDPGYESVLLLYGVVQAAFLLLGQRVPPGGKAVSPGRIEADDSFFRACWIFWGVAMAYKLAMLLVGGIAKYQHEESEALFRLPYVMNILDSLAFRVAPFVAWVACRGRTGLALAVAVAIDLAFGVTTLTKEYTLYVIVAAAFGLSYWGKSPSWKVVFLGAVASLLVFLLGPAMVWTRQETIRFAEPIEIVTGIAENVDKTLLDEIQRDVSFLAAKERFDLYSAGQLAYRQKDFREMAIRTRDALPFFWLPRSAEKEITFRSGNYLGASVGLVGEGDVSGIAFPNPVVADAMFGRLAGLLFFGSVSYLFGLAFRKVMATRGVEWWIGYVLLYLGILLQVYVGLPLPAIPYKLFYESVTWGACVLLLRGCRELSRSVPSRETAG